MGCPVHGDQSNHHGTDGVTPGHTSTIKAAERDHTRVAFRLSAPIRYERLNSIQITTKSVSAHIDTLNIIPNTGTSIAGTTFVSTSSIEADIAQRLIYVGRDLDSCRLCRQAAARSITLP
jgi:hypothetical protein